MHHVRIVNTQAAASQPKAMKKSSTCAVIARVPAVLRKRLDAAAKKSKRSRSAELQLRLEESLKRHAVLASSSPEVAP